MQAFLTIHSGLDREGPGDRDSLEWALDRVATDPVGRILDAGCGPGADLPGLRARYPAAQIVAMDTHQPYVDAARARLIGDAAFEVVCGDMAAPPGRFDLIWCAGAIYFLGVEAGLKGWRAHLAPGGTVAFSQLCWTRPDPSDAARAFWAAYPDMTDRAGVLAATARAGYRVAADRFLPRAAWAAYYDPLQARIDALRDAPHDADMAKALAAEQAEIDLWHAHGGDFGYLQVIAVPQ